jgi:hypothetical protein
MYSFHQQRLLAAETAESAAGCRIMGLRGVVYPENLRRGQTFHLHILRHNTRLGAMKQAILFFLLPGASQERSFGSESVKADAAKRTHGGGLSRKR